MPEAINHKAWGEVFSGLAKLPTEEIARALGIPVMTAGRLRMEALEYEMSRVLKQARIDLITEEFTDELR